MPDEARPFQPGDRLIWRYVTNGKVQRIPVTFLEYRTSYAWVFEEGRRHRRLVTPRNLERP